MCSNDNGHETKIKGLAYPMANEIIMLRMNIHAVVTYGKVYKGSDF